MTGVVITGGRSPEYKFIRKYLEKADIIVAADSGVDTAFNYNIKPDFAIGDMDSIQDIGLLDRITEKNVMRYGKDKDYTDTELALDYLGKNRCDKRIIIGGGGGRLDHLLALYTLFSRKESPSIWVTENEIIYLVEGNFSIDILENTIVSLFPVGKNPCRMKSFGLKWELNNLEWKVGNSGVSNVATGKTVKINMESGKLIMILPLDFSKN